VDQITSASNGQTTLDQLRTLLTWRIVAYEMPKEALAKDALVYRTIYIEVQELPEEILNRPASPTKPLTPSRYEERDPLGPKIVDGS